MLAAGKRTYRMLVAHDDITTLTLLGNIRDQMFCPDTWKFLRRKAADVRSLIFRMLARPSVAAHQLLRVRHRTWPYKLFALMRDDAIATELDEAYSQRACVLDSYSTDFAKTYVGALSGKAARAELELVGRFADTDTASAERIQSENTRRATFKV